MNDQELHLGGILLKVLLRWRLIIVCMVIGALAVDLGSYYADRKEAARIRTLIEEYEKNQEEIQNSENKDQAESTIALKEFEEKLTERQISEVQSVVSMYKMYQRPYTDTVEYINDSVKMQIDPNRVPTLVSQYLIDTHYSVAYPEITKRDYSADILNSVFYRLINYDTLKKLAAVLGEDTDPVYAREMVNLWSAANDIYCMSVIGRDEDECRALMQVLQESLPPVLDSLKELYGEFDYRLLSEEYSETFNQDMLNAQQTQADKLNNLRNSANGLINTLTEDQKTYFYAILNNDETVTLELPVEQNMEEVTDPHELTIPTPSLKSYKKILLGAFLGMFIAALYILCSIFLGGKLLTSETIEELFGIASLGSLRISEPPKGFLAGIDRWLIRLFDGKGSQFSTEEHLKMIAAGIRLSAVKQGWKNIYMTGTANDAGTQQAMEQICEALKGKVENVVCGKSIVYDPESLEAMTGSDVAVVVERVDVSRRDEIKSEFSLFRQHQVPVMGYVVLK